MAKSKEARDQMKKILDKIKGFFKKGQKGPPSLDQLIDKNQEEFFEDVELLAQEENENSDEIVEEVELENNSDDKEANNLAPPPAPPSAADDVQTPSSPDKTKDVDLSKFGFTPISQESMDENEDEVEIENENEEKNSIKESWDMATAKAANSIHLLSKNFSGMPFFFKKAKTWIQSHLPHKETLSSAKIDPKESLESFKTFSLKVWQTLHWDELISHFLSPEERPRINKFFTVILICSLSYLTGKIAGLLLTPQSNSLSVHPLLHIENSNIIPSPQDILAIKTANIFNAQVNEQDLGGKAKNLNTQCLLAQLQSNLPLKLLNTVVLQDTVKSVASVQVRGNSESLEVREGDKVESIASIGRIERLRLIFRNLQTGECEFVQNDELKNSAPGTMGGILDPKAGKKAIMESKMQGIRNVGNNFFIQKSIRDDLLKDIGSVLTQARAIQINNPDGTLSYKMTEVIPGSIYSHLNILENDIITQINGNKITGANDLMNMFAKIKQIDRWQMTVERDGSEQVLEYRFE